MSGDQSKDMLQLAREDRQLARDLEDAIDGDTGALARASLSADQGELAKPLGAEVKEALALGLLLEVRRARGDRIRRTVLALGGIAAAVAASLVFLLRTQDPPLPQYSAALVGGDRTIRSDSGAPGPVVTLSPTSRLDVQLRPSGAEPLRGEVALRAFKSSGGPLLPWSPPVSADPGGSLRVVGNAEALIGGAAGRRVLVFVVGRPKALGADPEEVARAAVSGAAPEGRGWQIFRFEVDYAPR